MNSFCAKLILPLRLLFITSILLNSFCISTVSPGILFNYTQEHVYPPGTSSQLGRGRIITKAETCNDGSYIFLSFIFHGTPESITETMSKAGITKIAVIDYSTVNILGPVFFRKCTIIWGE